jgi:hypothetical protein
MISEVLEYLLTPVDPRLRDTLRSSIGIRSRHRRLSAEWAPHLTQTRDFLIETMNTCDGNGVAILLGAGLHHDIPISAFANRFREVFLVDIVHPLFSSIPLMFRGNVHQMYMDLNGFIDIDLHTGKIRPDRSGVQSPSLPTLPPCDFMASVNVASQLALGGPEIRPVSTANPRSLVQRHLDELQAHPSSTKVLISDRWIRRSYPNDNGKRNRQDDALHGVSLRSPDKCWNWNLAPRGEIDEEVSVECEVHAWANPF